jgi:hypothetical protein
MHIRDCIAAISLVLLSTATASSGANYIRADATVPHDAIRTSRETSTNTSRGAGPVEHQREQQRPGVTRRSPGPPLPSGRTEEDGNGVIQDKKVLAALILMLRDGPGAR